MIAYLSGAIENAPNDGKEWRLDMSNWLKNNLSHSSINPVTHTEELVEKCNAQEYRNWKKNNPNKFKNFIRLIIKQDLEFVINKSDYLVVMWDKSVLRGGGTHGEITMAYWYKKPIYVVNTLPIDDFSAWIYACSTNVYSSFDELKIDLLKIYYNNK